MGSKSQIGNQPNVSSLVGGSNERSVSDRGLFRGDWRNF